MKNIAFVAVILVGASCRTPEPSPRTSVPDHATAARPTGPGPASLAFSCVSSRAVGCDAKSFSMSVLGDVPRCSVMGPGALRLELKSSNDANDGILIALEGYGGPGSYPLNDTARKFLQLSDGVLWNGCDGPTNMGKVVTAGDPSCASPACTVQVADETPSAPFPKTLTFSVHCESLCENGGGATCQGPMDFITRVSCG